MPVSRIPKGWEDAQACKLSNKVPWCGGPNRLGTPITGTGIVQSVALSTPGLLRKHRIEALCIKVEKIDVVAPASRPSSALARTAA